MAGKPGRPGGNNGGGRRKSTTAKRHNVMLDNDVWAYIEANGKSKEIERLVRAEMDNQYMTIFATQNESGKWTLTDSAGNEQQEGFEYDTAKKAMEAAAQLWPSNSVWEGERVAYAWRIKIN